MAAPHANSLKFATAVLVASLCALGLASALIPAAHAQTTVGVTINDYSFSPSSITVVIGVNNTVTWTNEQTGVTHTVTSDNGTWGSGPLASGASYTYTFTTPGTYGYHCSIHSYMKGTVRVLGSAPTSTTTTSSTTSAQTSAASTTSSSSAMGGVPEFPAGFLAVAAISAVVVASYLLTRRPASVGPRSKAPATA